MGTPAPLRSNDPQTPAPTIKVVSLVPSITETLLAWGLTPIACTTYCEQPDLTHVGGVKNPDLTRIIELEPDLVAVDRHENRSEDAEALTAAGIRLAVLNVDSLESVGDNLELLAAAVGLSPDRRATVAGEPLPEPHSDRELRVLVPIWRRPWMTIAKNTYGSSLLAALGATNVFADHDDVYPTITLDEVAAAQPDLIIVPSEPYSFKTVHLDELANIAPILPVDGQDLFWWGIRTPAALRRLRAAIQPSF